MKLGLGTKIARFKDIDPSVTQHSENIDYIMLTIYVNNEYGVVMISIVIVSGIL